ncbi:hypothetical protein GCM10010387_11430 [Streptomyces inusitatus]|uniref:NADH:ubiquinone oxidoreductase 30kDa subunit domain-containing protein n=1 Tax=Streptomyces inusitatus TaxID=68221 RepID=A0A918UMA9_9ACTN|nr:NADH-quinone oxidoreductase subunit C [Streptomyces inusitatus]GGZ20208.1 hypothetical protein GCM10010387_11430 [Streptomyces inusitatus]
MSAYDGLPDSVTEVFGPDATAELAYDLLTVDVPADGWIAALETARTTLGCTYFDWLSAVDEPGTGFRICAHVAALETGRVRRLLLRTTVPHDAPALPTAREVYAGADWHERETHEMFGVDFTGHPHLVPLLLPENFEGHPLRKDFVLAARVAKAWPGAKEPGEAEHGGPKRRQMLPPGVPDPNEWGPLKGQLPPAPARPARAARTPRAAGAGAAGAGAAGAERPVRRARPAADGTPDAPGTAPAPAARRARTAAEGSASQTTPAPATPPAAEATPETPAPAPAATPPRRTRSASDGSASQTPPDAAQAPAPAAETTPAPDAPWHHARPAFDDTKPAPERPPADSPAPAAPAPEATPAPEPTPRPQPEPESGDGPEGGEPTERTGGDPA